MMFTSLNVVALIYHRILNSLARWSVLNLSVRLSYLILNRLTSFEPFRSLKTSLVVVFLL